MSVYRIYVEKKPEFAVEAAGVLSDLRTVLMLDCVKGVRILNRYDVEGIDRADFDAARGTIFSEPQVDLTYDELPPPRRAKRSSRSSTCPASSTSAPIPAPSASQLATSKRTADRAFRAGVHPLGRHPRRTRSTRSRTISINPVESRRRVARAARHARRQIRHPHDGGNTRRLHRARRGGAGRTSSPATGSRWTPTTSPSASDYFRNTERRDPTITEIRMIDTYWSDHCRHTTFLTNLKNVEGRDPRRSKRASNDTSRCATSSMPGKRSR